MKKTWFGAGTILLLLIAVTVVALVIHNNNSKNLSPRATNAPGSSTQSATDWTVNIHNMMFTPSQVTINRGGTVTWTNNDSVSHTVEIDQGNGPRSGNIAPGKSFTYTFYNSGSYQYHCSIHPSMRGTIVVH